MGNLWLIGAAAWIVFPCLGLYVASQKGRSLAEGFVLSAILGPFGVLIVALLPTIEDDGEDEPIRIRHRRASHFERTTVAEESVPPDVDAFLDEMAERKRQGEFYRPPPKTTGEYHG